MAVRFNVTSFFHLFKLFWHFFWNKRLTTITKMSRHLLKHFHLERNVLYIVEFWCNFLWSVSFNWSIIVIRKYSIFSGSISIVSGNSTGYCSYMSSERSRTIGIEATIAWVNMILIYSWSYSGVTLHRHWRSTKSNST